VEDARAVAASLPYETYSSMHNDVQNGRQTEVEALTGYIVREGNKAGVEVPTFAALYERIKEKISAVA
jgi:2-dehydropantoate 2-reductase